MAGLTLVARPGKPGPEPHKRHFPNPTITKLGLAQFYLLDPEKKALLAHYSRNLCWDGEDGLGAGWADTGARFLWAATANAIPLGD